MRVRMSVFVFDAGGRPMVKGASKEGPGRLGTLDVKLRAGSGRAYFWYRR